MKKILLFVTSAFVFSFTSGQQNITPDIQKLIQERLKKEQNQKLKELNPLLKRVEKPRFTLPNTATPQAKFLQTLADGSKVYALPIDNMPCIVPDMDKYKKEFGTISPNVHPLLFEYLNNRIAGQIPNAVKPQKIIPDNSNK